MSRLVRCSVALALALAFAPPAHAMIPFMMLFGGGMMKSAKERDRLAEPLRAADAPAPVAPHVQSQNAGPMAGPSATEEPAAHSRATHDHAEIKSDGSP